MASGLHVQIRSTRSMPCRSPGRSPCCPVRAQAILADPGPESRADQPGSACHNPQDRPRSTSRTWLRRRGTPCRYRRRHVCGGQRCRAIREGSGSADAPSAFSTPAASSMPVTWVAVHSQAHGVTQHWRRGEACIFGHLKSGHQGIPRCHAEPPSRCRPNSSPHGAKSCAPTLDSAEVSTSSNTSAIARSTASTSPSAQPAFVTPLLGTCFQCPIEMTAPSLRSWDFLFTEE